MPGRKKTTKVSTAQAVTSAESRDEIEDGDLGGGGDGAQEVGMEVDQDFSNGSTFLRREFNPEGAPILNLFYCLYTQYFENISRDM